MIPSVKNRTPGPLDKIIPRPDNIKLKFISVWFEIIPRPGNIKLKFISVLFEIIL